MQFGNPNSFWLLAIVPLLIVFLVWANRARRRALERFAAQPLAGKLAASVNRVARRWKAVLLVDGLVGLAIFLVGLVVLALWNLYMGGFIGSIGLVYLLLVVRRARRWAVLRREAGM